MIYLHWLLLVLYISVIIVMMVTVLMDNRQPTKTMAWLLVLTFLPIVGIVLYIFFGQNVRKKRYVSKRSLDQLSKRQAWVYAEQKNLKVKDEHRDLVHLFYNQNGALPFKDNEVEIYTSGYEFFGSLLQQIGMAEHSIHLESFIFQDDELGYLIADALIDKARQGVEVRIIYDDVGCWNVRNKFFERMRNEGIDVHAFFPVKFPAFTSKMNYRDHRKICVIDGEVAFIGGMNIATRYVKGTPGTMWRDTHLKIRGGAVYGMQHAFLVDWYFVDRTLISDRIYYPPFPADLKINPEDQTLAQIVTSSPIAQWPDIEHGYVRILLQAKRYVYMESPYFLPTEPILFAMRVAALAGVDVRLMIPYKTDTRIVQWASRSFVYETLQAGVVVELYKKGFNHTKMLVSDDSISTCGSTNLDFRSFENNFESNVFFYGEPMAKRLKQVFFDDERDCVRIEDAVQVENRPFLKRLWESLLRLLSPLM
ncbi:MAG: cardiolipin synthase [Prevotella sp.]|jgi:cardiolipin synthase